ncbi:MAG: cation:proton antiporter [Candidatus Aenigmatarchaeota archaeon]
MSFLSIVGITIILGYIGNLIFDKTKIPDIIWLILFGLLVSHMNIVDKSIFIASSEIMCSIAIAFILFDSGINIKLIDIIKGVPRGLLLAILGIFFNTIAVTFVGFFFLKFDILNSILLGLIISGTSSPIVITILNKLKIKENIRSILNVESIITDALVIVLSLFLLNFLTQSIKEVNIKIIISLILSSFSISIFLGIVFGVIWLYLLQKIKGKEYDYMLTISVLLLLYVFSELNNASGAISALIFGLILGNKDIFSKFIKIQTSELEEKYMHNFYNQITFFIRSFFFVFIGLIISIKLSALIYGILITTVFILLRFLTIRISLIKIKISYQELKLISNIIPRGLAAAVLAIFAKNLGLASGQTILDITFTIILVTVIYTTLAITIFYRSKA